MKSENRKNFGKNLFCDKNRPQGGVVRSAFSFPEVKDFRCQQCLKQFGMKSSLKGHMETVHNKIKKFRCEKCPKQFGQKVV